MRLPSTVTVDRTGPERGFDPSEPYTPKRVIRGGSYLCTETFCFSYRPAARMPLPPDTVLPNVGFRLAMSPSPTIA